MKLHQINSSNLSNSLVFYRSLFNKMPQVITPYYIQFHLPNFQLEINEKPSSTDEDSPVLHLEIDDQMELEAISKRMSRFKSLASFQGNCEVVDKSIGLTDPDGTKWIIGDTASTTSFDKCYVSLSI
ncbi:hypothetical protein [Marinoscillum sp.]|uniref:hypothetical protein n=1 Tax=Marinoscillum sp. TaxID=2024838 RepID=UPI003BABB220